MAVFLISKYPHFHRKYLFTGVRSHLVSSVQGKSYSVDFDAHAAFEASVKVSHEVLETLVVAFGCSYFLVAYDGLN